MYKVLLAKGPNSFKAIWVKGHANAEHVNRGVLSEQQMIGNHKADAIADAGSETHGSEMLTVMRAMTLRFKSYIHFMRNVAHHIVEGYLIHRALVESKARKQAKADAHSDKRTGYQELAYPNGSQARS